jgi:cytochrome P450
VAIETRPTLEHEVRELLEGRRLDDPWPVWNRLREEAPVFRGAETIILSRFADLKEMLTSPERFSSRYYISGSRADSIVAAFTPEAQRMWREMAAYDGMMMTRSDGDVHDRLRRIAHRFFTPRRIRELAVTIQEFWDDILREAAEQEVYDHKGASQELALRVMTEVIGAPQVDRSYVAEMSNKIARYLGTHDEQIVREAYEARQQFSAYIEDVIIGGYRRDAASNDFVAALMDAEDEDNLSAAELSAMVNVLLFGGLETTAVLLSTGVIELTKHRDQWEWLAEDTSRVPDAIEELFRWVSPAQLVPRTASVDCEIGGVEVPAGQTMIGSIAAAHRDPEEFENPDVLDVRNGGRPHLGLGYGVHFCLGASLIRAEAKVAFTSLLERYPDLELAIAEDELDWSVGPPVLRSVRRLPVRLGPRRS